jgi:hypothetical protein
MHPKSLYDTERPDGDNHVNGMPVIWLALEDSFRELEETRDESSLIRELEDETVERDEFLKLQREGRNCGLEARLKAA